ncbi:RhuM family protein [Salinibacterium sp. G-O1]|uniref:RhuM family protein n=1 Tax=Salinibacterium sp. G-O1 TaxID=3046208 RepID=UPI0024B8C16A|nr:RhuM family protein [Salinibacterium sp. G-O1]MDJ0334916.1 RhuM family protein [Salinibacterium sp. G-O1]
MPEGDRAVEHHYLDMVLSIGYRVRSPKGMRFRRWANDVLKRHGTHQCADFIQRRHPNPTRGGV